MRQMPRIEITIDELIVDGAEVPDRDALSGALEQEITRLMAGGDAARADGRGVRGGEGSVAAQVARQIYERGLSAPQVGGKEST